MTPRLSLALTAALAVTACVTGPPPVDQAAQSDTVDQTITGMTRAITRDGIRLTDVSADSAWVFNVSGLVMMKKVGLTFYDASGAVRSTVIADSGVQYERTGVLDLRGNVVATTPAPNVQVLKTEHLIFDKTANLIRSDTVYSITSPSGNGSGQSFETDPDFRRFRSWQPRGYQKGEGFLLPRGSADSTR
jgi:LPS export ABC transporter protein LptC